MNSIADRAVAAPRDTSDIQEELNMKLYDKNTGVAITKMVGGYRV